MARTSACHHLEGRAAISTEATLRGGAPVPARRSSAHAVKSFETLPEGNRP